MEFEWNIFPGFTTAVILNEIQKIMGELQCDPADFRDRIIFMSMFNDIVWDAKGNEELCENDSKSVGEYARQFRGHWSFLGPGSQKKWYGTYDGIPSGCWTRTVEKMLLNFEKSGHPFFRCTSVLERGKSHFTASDENVQLLPKMVMSVNQLSLYGAVAEKIQELPEDQIVSRRLVALDQTEQDLFSTSCCRSTIQ